MGLMDIFRRFKTTFVPTGLASPFVAPTDLGTRGLFQAYSNTYSLYAISLRIAMATSEVVWQLFTRSPVDGARNQIFIHPILELLNNPNPFQTGAEMIEFTQLNLDISGKAFWFVPKNLLGVPGEIWVIPSNMIQPVPSKHHFISGFVVHAGAEQIPLGIEEVIWFKMPDLLNPWEGVGYADAASVEIQTENAAGRWNRNFFSNSARPDGVLEYEGALTEEEFERLKESWQQSHRGVSRSHKIAILEGGVTYKQIQNTIKEMDFNKGRRLTRENLMFTFGMPQSVMGISENVNRANAEAGEYAFTRWLIHPRLVKMRDKCNRRLIPMFKTGALVELDFVEVVPETIEQRRLNAESGIRSGYATVNEARANSPLTLDPLTGSIGNDLLVPLNLLPTDTGQKIKRGKGLVIESDEKKERFWLAYIAKSASVEQALIDKLKGFFERQAEEAVDRFLETQGNATRLIDTGKANEELRDLMEPLLSDLMLESFDDGLILVNPPIENRSQKQEGVAQAAALRWLRMHLRIAASEVNRATVESIARQLAEGFEKGEGIDVIAGRVESVFEQASRSRALKIARTETISAAAEGAIRGYDESGVVKEVQFLTAMDERVDPDCEALDGRVFSLSESRGIIPVHPNCRCTWIPVV